MKTCPICQRDNKDESHFCGFCGASLEAMAVPVPVSAPYAESGREIPAPQPAPEPAVSGVGASAPLQAPPMGSGAPAAAPFSSMPPVPPASPYSPARPPYTPPQEPYSGGYPTPVMHKSQSGLSIAAFVLAMISLFVWVLGPFNVFLYVAISLTIAAWATRKPHQGKGLAIAATVLSALALAITVVYTVRFLAEMDDLYDDDDDYSYRHGYSDRYDYDDWLNRLPSVDDI